MASYRRYHLGCFRSSCNLMEAFIILPCFTSKERFEIQQSPVAPVRLSCPYHLHYYELISHRLACQPTPSFDLRGLPVLLSFPSGARMVSPVDSAFSIRAAADT